MGVADFRCKSDLSPELSTENVENFLALSGDVARTNMVRRYL